MVHPDRICHRYFKWDQAKNRSQSRSVRLIFLNETKAVLPQKHIKDARYNPALDFFVGVCGGFVVK